MWKQISIIKPPEDTLVLFGYFDDIIGKITRVEDGIYSKPVYPFWANIWMEIPLKFHQDHIYKMALSSTD